MLPIGHTQSARRVPAGRSSGDAERPVGFRGFLPSYSSAGRRAFWLQGLACGPSLGVRPRKDCTV